MIGFEHRDSVPGSDRSTNCAEYFANNQNKLLEHFKGQHQIKSSFCCCCCWKIWWKEVLIKKEEKMIWRLKKCEANDRLLGVKKLMLSWSIWSKRLKVFKKKNRFYFIGRSRSSVAELVECPLKVPVWSKTSWLESHKQWEDMCSRVSPIYYKRFYLITGKRSGLIRKVYMVSIH